MSCFSNVNKHHFPVGNFAHKGQESVMKKLMVVLFAFGMVMGMVSCGTEDDPTLGIDAGQYTNEEAVTTYYYCQAANGLLTGKCIGRSLNVCFSRVSASCPVGQAAGTTVASCRGYGYVAVSPALPNCL